MKQNLAVQRSEQHNYVWGRNEIIKEKMNEASLILGDWNSKETNWGTVYCVGSQLFADNVAILSLISTTRHKTTHCIAEARFAVAS